MVASPAVSGNATYSTAEELTFLHKLGSHHSRQARVRLGLADRRTLLKRYRAALATRTSWGTLDREVLTRAVERMLEETR